MVQLKVIHDLRRQKADLTYPIYFRVTEYDKTIYLSTGYSINQEHWDKQACKVVKAHPNAAMINAGLTKRYFEIQKAVIKLEEEGRFTFTHLKEMLGEEPRKSVLTVKEFTDGLIADMLKHRKIGNAAVYQSALNALSHFKPVNKLRFIDVTLKFLEYYYTHLLRDCHRIFRIVVILIFLFL